MQEVISRETHSDYFPSSAHDATFSKIELQVPLISLSLSLALSPLFMQQTRGIVYGSEGVLSPVLRCFARLGV